MSNRNYKPTVADERDSWDRLRQEREFEREMTKHMDRCTCERHMSCPTCDHTMQFISEQGSKVYWCPRCGTLRIGEKDEVPKLVTRCRDFQATPIYSKHGWMQSGIEESINQPADRPRHKIIGF